MRKRFLADTALRRDTLVILNHSSILNASPNRGRQNFLELLSSALLDFSSDCEHKPLDLEERSTERSAVQVSKT